MTSFKTKAELEAHYTATRARLWGKGASKAELSPLREIPQIPQIKPIVEQPQRVVSTLDRLRDIAHAHGFTFEQLRGSNPKRTTAQVAARREIMAFLADEKKWSKNRIARTLDIDHTSVIHGLGKIREPVRPIEPNTTSEPEWQTETGSLREP